MPIYTYKCDDCGATFEKLKSAHVVMTRCTKCPEGTAFIVPSVPAKTTVGKYGKGGTK